MNKITTTDGTPVHLNDWGNGQATGLSRYWPARKDAYEDRILVLALLGFRCMPGSMKSDAQSIESWQSNNLDACAEDLPGLIYTIDLNDGVHLGCYLDGHGSLAHQGTLIGIAISSLCIKS